MVVVVNMRAARVAVAAGALALFSALGLLVPFIYDIALAGMVRVCPPSQESAPLLPVDFALILEAVLAHENFEGLPPPPPSEGQGKVSADVRSPVVLANETLVICAGSLRSATDGCPSFIDDEIMSWPGADFRIPRRMRHRLSEANRNAVALPRIENPYVIVETEVAIRSAVHNGGRAWMNFYSEYPGTAGYVRVSRPILSEDGTWAVILVEHHCGGLCGTGKLHLLMRGPSGWSVVVTDWLWMS